MEHLSGSLIAQLADKRETYDRNLIKQINTCVKPPRPVKADDVNIRAMYIVSDRINSQGGCFAEEDLNRLTDLLVDSPVMVGHRRDSLPLARNFKAEKVELDGRTWIKSYFYWMKESDGADDLKNNIDGGIYKECSISFLFKFPECSICGEDIRTCRHIPFHEYDTSLGRREIAHFKYRHIKKVLETSLVFRGAVPETKITDRLCGERTGQIAGTVTTAALFTKTQNDLSEESQSFSRAELCIARPEEFKPIDLKKPHLVYPHQPGLVLRVTREDENINLESSVLLPSKIQKHLIDWIGTIPQTSFIADFLLFATRGKERRDGLALMQIIESETNLHRLRLRLCDLITADGISHLDKEYADRLNNLSDWLNGQQKSKTAQSRIDILHPRQVSPADLSASIRDGSAASYNYGLEIVIENDTGGLVRHVLRRDKLTPARIEDITVKSRKQLHGTFLPLGDDSPPVSLDIPRSAGLERGAVVLLYGLIDNCRRKSAISLADIIPGTEAARIKCGKPDNSYSQQIMSALIDKYMLTLYFHCNQHNYRAKIHHYSSKLFGAGRRFVADIEESVDEFLIPSTAHLIPLASVTKSNELIRLKAIEDKSIFGEVTELSFSPVYIDRVMRHLFYAGRSTDLHAE